MSTTLGGLPVSINYLSRDYDSIRDDMLSRAGTLFPEWTNQVATDPGVVLIELTAHAYDVLSYYIDRCANETFLRTAVQRRSVKNLCSWIGYTLSLPKPAVVTATLSYTGIPPAGTTRVAGTQYSTIATATAPAVIFELAADLAVAAGANVYPNQTLIQGETISNEAVATSDVSIDQIYQLRYVPASFSLSGDDTILVSVDGTPWTLVDSFVDSLPTDLHYTLSYDEDDNVWISFSDGNNGSIPGAGLPITATYRTGGGTSGNNIGVGNVSVVLTALGVAGTETVNNTTVSAGGTDKETIAHAKKWAPRVFRTHGDNTTIRAITHEDYEAVAVAGGALNAKASRGANPQIERIVCAVAGINPVPSGYWNILGQFGFGQLGSIGAFVSTRAESGKLLDMRAPVAVDIEIEQVLHINARYKQSFCVALVKNTLLAALYPDTFGFAEVVPLSHIHNLVEDLEGIDWVEDVIVRRIPVGWGIDPIGDAAFSSFYMDYDCDDEIYTLTFQTPSTFTVEGTVSGAQSVIGVNDGTLWISDDQHLMFKLTKNLVDNVPGDTYQIRVQPKVGTIWTDAIEIPRLQDTAPTLRISAVGGIPR